MGRKMTLESAIKQAEAADIKIAETEKALKAAKAKQAKCYAKVDEIKAKQERERLILLQKLLSKGLVRMLLQSSLRKC